MLVVKNAVFWWRPLHATVILAAAFVVVLCNFPETNGTYNGPYTSIYSASKHTLKVNWHVGDKLCLALLPELFSILRIGSDTILDEVLETSDVLNSTVNVVVHPVELILRAAGPSALSEEMKDKYTSSQLR